MRWYFGWLGFCENEGERWFWIWGYWDDFCESWTWGLALPEVSHVSWPRGQGRLAERTAWAEDTDGVRWKVTLSAVKREPLSFLLYPAVHLQHRAPLESPGFLYNLPGRRMGTQNICPVVVWIEGTFLTYEMENSDAQDTFFGRKSAIEG